jgi:hypothetical protein
MKVKQKSGFNGFMTAVIDSKGVERLKDHMRELEMVAE